MVLTFMLQRCWNSSAASPAAPGRNISADFLRSSGISAPTEMLGILEGGPRCCICDRFLSNQHKQEGSRHVCLRYERCGGP